MEERKHQSRSGHASVYTPFYLKVTWSGNLLILNPTLNHNELMRYHRQVDDIKRLECAATGMSANRPVMNGPTVTFRPLVSKRKSRGERDEPPSGLSAHQTPSSRRQRAVTRAQYVTVTRCRRRVPPRRDLIKLTG